MVLYVGAMMAVALFRKEAAAQDRMIRGMTMFSIRHMNALPLEWHEAQGSGSQLQRVMAARAALQRLSTIYRWSLTPVVGAALAVVFSIVASHAPVWLLLPYIGLMTTFPLTAWWRARPIPALHDRHNAVLERLMGGVYEFVSAIRTVKTFRMEPFIAARALTIESEGHRANVAVAKAIFLKLMSLNVVGAFWIIWIFGLCIFGMYRHWLNAGTFATCFFAGYNLWNMLDSMTSVQDDFIEARAGFMRLVRTLEQAPKPLDLPPVCPVPPMWDTIKLQDVGYHYAGQGPAALDGISLAIRRGEKVALVGRSGAGKSTLVKLLLKQAWPDHGVIRVGDVDLRQIDSTDWLRRTGYVPQDVELFNLPVRDNILLDRLETSDEAYRRAIDQAALSDFIASLPDGDETLVGERGVKLSGGQRQRLGIARALVRQAEIIIFDEATSALDSLSETAIREAMDTAFADKTVILIAHRLATVRHVDRIFVLEDGRLIEQGSFDELLRQNGLFARLWALQSEAGSL